VLPQRCRIHSSEEAAAGAMGSSDPDSFVSFAKPETLTKAYFFLFNDVLLLIDSKNANLHLDSVLDKLYVLPLRRLFVFNIPENYGSFIYSFVLAPLGSRGRRLTLQPWHMQASNTLCR